MFTRNPYAVWPLFCQQVLAIESFDCPLWSMILPFLNRKFFTPGNGEIDYLEERAVACLKNHSLKEIVNEGKMCDNLLFKIFVIKAKMLQAMIYAHGIHPDSLDDFISSFIDEYKFQQVSFTLFATLFQQRFGVDIRDEWVRWYEDSGIPFYVFQDCCYRKVMEGEAERENSLLQLEFTVLNEGNRDGIVTVEWTKKHIKGKDFPFRKDYRVKAGQAKRIACVISASDYRINLNLAGNVPRRMSFMSGPIIPFLVDTVQYEREVDIEKFFRKGEIIVDNEDEGFQIHQSSLKIWQKHHSESLPVWERHIRGVNYSQKVGDSWTPFLCSEAYGRYIKGNVCRYGGSGKSWVEWRAELPLEGEYEVWVYLPESVDLQWEYDNMISYSERKVLTQKYWVEGGHFREEREIPVEGKENWRLLGVFPFEEGDCKVFLSDYGKKWQIITADAVKWVYRGKR